EFATVFGHLMSEMRLGKRDMISPEAFHSVFVRRHPSFCTSTQHDAQEFLICVLDELHKDFKEVRAQLCQRRNKTGAEARGNVSDTSIITDLFEGQLSYNITCLRCKTTTARPESFTVLSLPIPSRTKCSLQDCLKCFFRQDTLTQNNQIYCSWCGTNQDATVKAIVTTTPEIIIFHLKRFAWQDWGRKKLSTTVCYPLSNLDLSPYSNMSSSSNAQYSLRAVVNHAGRLDYGHYTALCKHSDHWHRFDDTEVTRIPDSSVQTDTAYLLFY
ncbi:Putative ubiquitin carboxyl-terminal hydrolase 50, partial [Acanthisitta chloris]